MSPALMMLVLHRYERDRNQVFTCHLSSKISFIGCGSFQTHDEVCWPDTGTRALRNVAKVSRNRGEYDRVSGCLAVDIVIVPRELYYRLASTMTDLLKCVSSTERKAGKTP